LFFGCRNKVKDFYLSDEWHELETKSLLTVFTAFSRDQVFYWLTTCWLRQLDAVVLLSFVVFSTVAISVHTLQRMILLDFVLLVKHYIGRVMMQHVTDSH